MNIISGRYKGAGLYSVPGYNTRPTSSFKREMIFSMYHDYEGKRVLDLFAGTGALGLEALSRGAVWADFVEFANPAIGVLIKNIKKLSCSDSCHVHRRRVEAFIKRATDAWDVIFMDAPYDKNLINPCLKGIYESGMLKPEGVVIVEHSRREPIGKELQPYLIKHKEGKVTCLSILGAAPTDVGKSDTP
ncbi:MAG: 16S rRNA (guanine(966)-N(2))-methyltransferase RsmD [Candidatus Cloacimonetes bacterium]|nr:16S rRNA (guanine(966)-N(2))-methyltransferase RsmD [Candidatus Cloacimonadota bacterium]NLO11935.1 16S rRNA (guanine(966)-N(2))-methyltransferase RsmD [Candidatus Cloacimonadota bacterium]